MDPTSLTTNLDGATRLHLIIGDPIAQVKSPAGLTRKFVAAGRNDIVVPIRVTSADLPAFLAGVSLAGNVDSIIITIPHKFACFAHCESVSERARRLGAVQHMRRTPSGGWHGENFDGVSFVTGARERGARFEGARTLLIGAGGAGSAIALALLEAGVAELAIHDADAGRRDALLERLRQGGAASVRPGSRDPAGFDIVVNATPMGMAPEDPLPVDVGRLAAGSFVGCVITAPAVSPLIAAARATGCRTSTGLDMTEAAQKLGLAYVLGGQDTSSGAA
ncbi:shikimate dehydrogenase family protein [Bosea sp. (in: a-proteobacteria)]|jgi:shikimate dehydrogenase|uniref:shikimate dehydrogenase family protein n=1 Tax=Bosea sp. (in: a-proteobacteria) TaxID=1871050 RepID=UPI003F7073EB